MTIGRIEHFKILPNDASVTVGARHEPNVDATIYTVVVSGLFQLQKRLPNTCSFHPDVGCDICYQELHAVGADDDDMTLNPEGVAAALMRLAFIAAHAEVSRDAL